MAKHLVLAGAGHAHLELLAHLGEITGRGHRVTVVSADAWHYYSGMGPGLLGGHYRPEQIRFPVRALTERGGGHFLEQRLTAIRPELRRLQLADGGELDYDLLCCNLGSEVPAPFPVAAGSRVVAAKPIVNLVALRDELLQRPAQTPLRLLVIGGGPSGVELAGNLWRLAATTGATATVTLAAGGQLLEDFPDRVVGLVRRSLETRGIILAEGSRVADLTESQARLEDGRRLDFDLALLATGVRPPSLFAAAGLATGPGGGLLVDSRLRSVSHPEVFGGGDCIDFAPQPLARVGVYAVRQGPLLRRNLLAALEGEPLEEFSPQPAFLQIFNLGDGRGVACRGSIAWHGRSAFWLKDFIDRRFMARYRRWPKRVAAR